MARLTTTGQNLVAAAVASGPQLEITKFVFANIPGLVHTTPEPADEPMPNPAYVVFERAPTRQGIIDENRVTYSQMMMTDVGNFSFNWIGLVYTDPVEGDQLVMFAYVPLTQKIKTEGTTAGNVLTRNLVIEHLGIANATPIEVSAESWMFDFVGEINAVRNKAVNKFEYNPASHVCKGIAQREIIVFDEGQNETVTLDAAVLVAGDVVEIQKLNTSGRIDIVGSVEITLPNGISEINHWLPDGKVGTLIFECVAENELRYAGGY
ncbi:phage tail protein [Rheinheimera marina]|uniref:Phage tail protein n=1 Tax=Rheinheimera marina TaxID=1774958 RepID=A0ABV9JJG5_9GAMM